MNSQYPTLSLLFCVTMLASSASVASTITHSALNPPADLLAESPVSAENVNSSANTAINHQHITQQSVNSDLYALLTSSDYSKKIETDVPKPKEKKQLSDTELSWLQKIIDFILNRESSSASSSPSLISFSFFVKLLLLVALAYLIFWIVKHAENIQGWIKTRQWQRNGSNLQIEDYHQAHLAQGWEVLPPHHQVPQVVQQLVDDKRLLPAYSILYRASLRWLNQQSLGINIQPATTEMRCMAHLKRIHDNTAFSHETSVVQAGNFISAIISDWIPVAYQATEQLKPDHAIASALAYTEQWVTQLPTKLNLASHSHTQEGVA